MKTKKASRLFISASVFCRHTMIHTSLLLNAWIASWNLELTWSKNDLPMLFTYALRSFIRKDTSNSSTPVWTAIRNSLTQPLVVSPRSEFVILMCMTPELEIKSFMWLYLRAKLIWLINTLQFFKVSVQSMKLPKIYVWYLMKLKMQLPLLKGQWLGFEDICT